MNDFSEIRPKLWNKFKGEAAKHVLVQKGSRLFSLDSIFNQESFEIGIKKINLQCRPASSSSSMHHGNSTRMQRTILEKPSTPRGFLGSHKKNSFLKTYSFTPSFLFKENPFQNERLKAPLSGKSYLKKPR